MSVRTERLGGSAGGGRGSVWGRPGAGGADERGSPSSMSGGSRRMGSGQVRSSHGGRVEAARASQAECTDTGRSSLGDHGEAGASAHDDGRMRGSRSQTATAARRERSPRRDERTERSSCSGTTLRGAGRTGSGARTEVEGGPGKWSRGWGSVLTAGGCAGGGLRGGGDGDGGGGGFFLRRRRDFVVAVSRSSSLTAARSWFGWVASGGPARVVRSLEKPRVSDSRRSIERLCDGHACLMQLIVAVIDAVPPIKPSEILDRARDPRCVRVARAAATCEASRGADPCSPQGCHVINIIF